MSPLVISAFLMGLFGGVHCVAMCGGVVGVLCSAAPRCPTASVTGGGARGGSGLRNAPYWIAYNGGRIASYAVLGLAFAFLGTLSSWLFPLDAVRFGLRALAALCMLAVGLHLAGLPSVVKRLESLGAPLWKRLSPVAKRFLPLRSPWHALALGGLWGLMPCGLLYGALAVAASAPTPAAGAWTMAAFGLGTLPVMLTVSAFAQSVVRWLAHGWVKRAAGVAFLAFGLWSTAGLLTQIGGGALFGRSHAHGHCCATR